MEVVVLVSGRGSNLRALLEATQAGRCQAQVRAVVADREGTPAVALADAQGISTRVVSPRDYPDRDSWDGALAEAVAAFAPGLVVLAGFMRIVGPRMLASFAGRVINVHPSLLPAFPGMDAPKQAVARGVSLSGCTVHVVDAGVDTGPILAQAAVPVLAVDDAATLHARIQRAEHALLPAVVDAIGRGRIRLEAQGPRHLGPWEESPACLSWPVS